MKKIDLHIHTVPTVSDADFRFDLSALQQYVSVSTLDAIAITNHNVFDSKQFSEITNALEIVVFPGIEVTLDCGHILIIADTANLDTFEKQATQISAKIKQPQDNISIDELMTVFYNLGQHLVIPHSDKKPAVKAWALERLKDFVFCGEVNSPKKFLRAIKDQTKLTPVLFSDVRICEDLSPLPTRQTFIDCGELTLSAIKSCLRDKTKVALSMADGNSLFLVFDDGQMLSTGLNILLGERSSGKTFTLDRINESQDYVKYIRQFSLVQQNDAAYEREFSDELKKTRSQRNEDYLSGFKTVLSEVMNVDLRADEREVENYVNSLVQFAEEEHRRDEFSNTALFDSSEFPISKDKVLYELIESVRHVIENIEYKSIIEKHVSISSLKQLAMELIELIRAKRLESKEKKLVNELVRDIKVSLSIHTSSTKVKDVDLYQVTLNKRIVERFLDIVKCIQQTATISEEFIQDFRVVATKDPFSGAGEVKAASGVKTALRDAFEYYQHPYEYLQKLIDNDDLTRSELYRLFVKITYKILNKDGFEVSGGERSEFRLLQQINDAQNYEILLVDEPESSFDNIFLRSDVNQIIKNISKKMPVVVVTHNSTVGASIDADYLLYAQKSIVKSEVRYKLFSGYPIDRTLCAPDGTTISNHEIILNSLEAGTETYDQRRQGYEAIKD
ncbi:phosphotransferase [bacterium AH-315-J21]|nr:phosphotransferase [bacterium AH-315-J21]